VIVLILLVAVLCGLFVDNKSSAGTLAGIGLLFLGFQVGNLYIPHRRSKPDALHYESKHIWTLVVPFSLLALAALVAGIWMILPGKISEINVGGCVVLFLSGLSASYARRVFVLIKRYGGDPSKTPLSYLRRLGEPCGVIAR